MFVYFLSPTAFNKARVESWVKEGRRTSARTDLKVRSQGWRELVTPDRIWWTVRVWGGGWESAEEIC